MNDTRSSDTEQPTCRWADCENEATHWDKYCKSHAKEMTGHPDNVANENGMI